MNINIEGTISPIKNFQYNYNFDHQHLNNKLNLRSTNLGSYEVIYYHMKNFNVDNTSTKFTLDLRMCSV